MLRLAWQDKDHVLTVMRRTIAVLDATPLERRLWTVEEKGLRVRGAEEDRPTA